MLPSRGFFKKNDCPFFEKGLCGRPHCHFRHRKKVASENSSSTDSQDLPISDNLADISLADSVNNEINSTATEDASSKANEDEQHSANNADSKEDQTKSQDSLFAKLVNQPNSYEKISRHIPCAYTPTPQIKGAQPKNRVVNAKSSVNSSKAIDILAKTQNDSDFNSVNIKKNSCTSLPDQNQELNSLQTDVSNSLSNEPNNKYSINSTVNSTISSKNSEYKISFFESKESNSLSYEPQTTSKSVISDLDKNLSEGSTLDYMPSKVTIPESKYFPNIDDSLLPNDYVPSKDKPQKTQYVPEATVSIKNLVNYKPSDKSSSGETQYQPGSTKFVAEYVPTEKSATKSSGNSSINWELDGKNEWSDFDFITSEIEMMKELLKEDTEEKIEDEIISKTELSNENEKVKEINKKSSSSRSHHSSSSRHRTKSSGRSHSSSKSKHSSSSRHSSRGSNSSSRHHSSSSSKHHSSSKSKKSSDDHSSSDGHRKNGDDSHKSSRHRSSHKSHRRSKENHSRTDDDSKEKHRSEKEKEKSVSSSDEDNMMEDFLDSEKFGSDEEMSESSDLKKRKSEWNDEERNIKLLKQSEEEIFDDLEDDPDAVEKECLEIFNSYSNLSSPTKKPVETTVSTEEYDSTMQGKKRTAHSTSVMSDHSVLRQKAVKKMNIKSAQETMFERYKVVEKAKEPSTPVSTFQPAPISGLSRPSIRIAAVSNIQQMLQAKKAIQEKINQGIKVNERTTIAQTVSQGGSRVAHTPTSKDMIERPTISIGSKQIPRVKRQIYLDKLILETNQIYPTKGESAEEALRLEEEVFRAHSGSFSAYHAAFVSTLMKTRRRITALKGETSFSNSTKPKVSHSDVLSGGKRNFSVIKAKKVDISMLTDRHIYEELLRCKLTEEELKLNGFPVESDRIGYASCTFNFELKYNTKYLHIKKMTGNRRYCIRCSKQYEVHPKTLKQYKEGPETCSYHPGRKKSGGRNSERIYNCCNSASTEGCTTHVRHVTDCNDYDNLPNCVKTLSKENEANPGVFALDCEMVYTSLGCELARVTVVNLKKEVVYDTLVKPKYPIECYNTFYSGIEEKMMEGVTTTLKDVQAVLLNMFSDKTILIGHSLDSDLRALHLIHDTVVDTAIVYKNEKYHPYKYSLKDLCAKKISKIIQDNVGGHDSAEDATAALEIMLNHVKEEVSKYDSMESYEADRLR